MDESNPAVAALTNVPPALLELVENDPKEIGKIARKMLVVQIDAIHRRLRDPAAPLGMRLTFAEMLGKMGDAYPKANAVAPSGTGFNVNIIMNAPQKPAVASSADVVDVEAKPAPSATVVSVEHANA